MYTMISDRSLSTITNSKSFISTLLSWLFILFFSNLLSFDNHGIHIWISILIFRDILTIVKSLILDTVSINYVWMFKVRIILFEIWVFKTILSAWFIYVVLEDFSWTNNHWGGYVCVSIYWCLSYLILTLGLVSK